MYLYFSLLPRKQLCSLVWPLPHTAFLVSSVNWEKGAKISCDSSSTDMFFLFSIWPKVGKHNIPNIYILWGGYCRDLRTRTIHLRFAFLQIATTQVCFVVLFSMVQQVPHKSGATCRETAHWEAQGVLFLHRDPKQRERLEAVESATVATHSSFLLAWMVIITYKAMRKISSVGERIRVHRILWQFMVLELTAPFSCKQEWLQLSL